MAQIIRTDICDHRGDEKKQKDQSEIRRALCFGCWLQAGVLATVENGRVVKLRGEPGHPVNKGWICERSKAFIEHLYHEDRLNYPLKRNGKRGEGKWEKISWEEALDEVSAKLAQIRSQSGAEAVASVGGTGRGFSEMFKVRFMNLFGSPNHANAGQWCSVVSRQIHAAIYGAGASRAVKPPCKCASNYLDFGRTDKANRPAVCHQQTGLDHLELFVVAEQWMTPSAMLADYVFPITSWLERRSCIPRPSRAAAARRRSGKGWSRLWANVAVILNSTGDWACAWARKIS